MTKLWLKRWSFLQLKKIVEAEWKMSYRMLFSGKKHRKMYVSSANN